MKRPFPTVLAFAFITLIVVACGPAGGGTVIETEASAEELAPQVTLEELFETEATDVEPLVSSVPEEELPIDDDIVEDDTEAEEVTEESVTTTAVEALTIEVDPNTVGVDAKGVEVGFTLSGHAYRGNPAADIVIEEFSDFQCPFCARFAAQTLPSLEENQIAKGEVVLIYYDFPLTSIHPQAFAASNAARCAGEQSAATYWAFHDLLFNTIGDWSNNNANAYFESLAQDLGLDTAVYAACLENETFAEQIHADIALAQSRGVQSTPSFFINDQPLIGAQPLAVFESAIATIKEGGDLESTQAASAPAQPQVKPTAAAITVDDSASTMGDPNAPITIVEYTDYQCPFCLRHATETMPRLIQEMIDTGRVYYVLKDFPLESIHPEARAAAIAVRCAGEFEVYWEMHDVVFESQQQWGGGGNEAANAYFVGLADELGLDTGVYGDCLASGRYDDAVQAHLVEGSALGVRGTPFFFIDGFPINGAQPYDLFEYAVGLAEEGTLADAYVQNTQEQAQQTPPEPQGPVEVSIDDAFSIGDPDAPITIIEYTDFQCPFCSRHFAQTYPQIVSDYVDTGLVRYVFKDFPLTSIHPQAVVAAEAARCAGAQGAYLEMHDILFSTQAEWNGRGDVATLFVGYANQLGLDTEAMTQCLADHTYEEAVLADLDEGMALGVRGTPAFFINGYLLSGAQPYSTFQQAIDSLAAEVEQ